jgi:glycolate oxidase iron-sulfur subunit
LAETEHSGAAGNGSRRRQINWAQGQHIRATGAQAVFTGNVGCLLQINRHLRRQGAELWVAHPIDALWASYSGVKTQ